ncbi:MAG: DUF6194 family protein [Anaerolineae bacterium]|jgi:hypothetical protein|nr:DUF6194 family protein [Anaerolineae bacterium]
MNQTEVQDFVAGLDEVQQEDNYGYRFFFVGDDHRVAFVTIGYEDNEFDTVSQLNREGVFRVNIGVSKATFQALLPEAAATTPDYAALNVFLPHPHYARQHYLCILNPAGDNATRTRELIVEAHGLAAARQRGRSRPD